MWGPGFTSVLEQAVDPQTTTSGGDQAKAGALRRKGEVSWYRSQSRVQRAVAAVCEKPKMPTLTPHALRRTFEDLLREAGVEKMVRRAVAGWRTDTAQGIYATVKREERDAAAAALVELVMGGC